MDRLMIAVYDEATDTIIEREMTDAEHAEFWAANEIESIEAPIVEAPATENVVS